MTQEEPVTSTFYVTKWWDTQGIQEVQGYTEQGAAGVHLVVPKWLPSVTPSWGPRTTSILFFKGDYHPTLDEARARVKLQIQRKLQSLEKKVNLLKTRLILVGLEPATTQNGEAP